jgi:methionyl-tRNA formyltransferase
VTNIIACQRTWCSQLAERLEKKTTSTFHFIQDSSSLNVQYLERLDPEFLFFPHWSNIIPASIYEKYPCVIFHMTDLPYGRGGSPLQNLIVQGHTETVVSAIQCVKELDAGPVYLKKPLSLLGSAEEIYIRANKLIEEMIVEILREQPQPSVQVGEVINFQRRKPEQGDWSNVESLEQVFNHIRMLDAEGYPPAFVKVGAFRLEFKRASLRTNCVHADVKIIEERNE